MGYWEKHGASEEWYTPAYIFEAMGVQFDLDVAHPPLPTHVPCKEWLSSDSLEKEWRGFIWMNPPFGGRNGLRPWINKFFAHGNGVALTPDRTSAPWWQYAAASADAILFVAGKIRFLRPDGSEGVSPSNGTTLLASGQLGVDALSCASAAKLGFLVVRQ